MTCIAAVVDADSHIYMGGDSAGVSDDSVYSLGIGAESKIWEKDGVLFGASGSFRVSQVLRWQMSLPQYNPSAEPLEYLTGPLITAMRETLMLHGALSVWEEDSTENIDGSLLLGFCGRVFEIYDDFGVGELVHGYGSVGCGSPIAMGSLAATESSKVKPRKRITMALEAAERHSAGVRSPFTILKV
jgi:hypothetical protein